MRLGRDVAVNWSAIIIYSRPVARVDFAVRETRLRAGKNAGGDADRLGGLGLPNLTD